MAAPLALIAFWPTPIDQPLTGQLSGLLTFLHLQGVPTWLDYAAVEAAANIALFVPLGFVASMAFPRRPAWQNLVLGLAVSCSIEVGQALFLPDRFASVLDIAMNTLGAAVGVAAAGFLQRRRWS